jgi:hypothetical protein
MGSSEWVFSSLQDAVLWIITGSGSNISSIRILLCGFGRFYIRCGTDGVFVHIQRPEAEFLDKIQTNNPILRVFLLAIHSHLYRFALRYLQTHTTSYNFYSSQLLYTVKGKGGKPDGKNYIQKPQRHYMSMNSASEQILIELSACIT